MRRDEEPQMNALSPNARAIVTRLTDENFTVLTDIYRERDSEGRLGEWILNVNTPDDIQPMLTEGAMLQGVTSEDLREAFEFYEAKREFEKARDTGIFLSSGSVVETEFSVRFPLSDEVNHYLSFLSADPVSNDDMEELERGHSENFTDPISMGPPTLPVMVRWQDDRGTPHAQLYSLDTLFEVMKASDRSHFFRDPMTNMELSVESICVPQEHEVEGVFKDRVQAFQRELAQGQRAGVVVRSPPAAVEPAREYEAVPREQDAVDITETDAARIFKFAQRHECHNMEEVVNKLMDEEQLLTAQIEGFFDAPRADPALLNDLLNRQDEMASMLTQISSGDNYTQLQEHFFGPDSVLRP